MADTRFFLIGCMKRQHAVVLESIWETDSIITHFPVQRTGLLTPLLTCFTLLSFSLFTWTNYSKSNSLSPFCLLDKNFMSPNSSSLFSSDKNILSPTSILQKYSETIPNSVLAANSYQPRKNILRHSKFCLSRKFIPTCKNILRQFQILSYPQIHSNLQKYPKTIPNFVLSANSFQPAKIF